jgi:hypothetical protein
MYVLDIYDIISIILLPRPMHSFRDAQFVLCNIVIVKYGNGKVIEFG